MRTVQLPWQASGRSLLIGLFSAMLFAAAGAIAVQAADKSATEAQLKELRSRIESLRAQQEQRRRAESAARAELADIETRMGMTNRALKATRQELAAARQRLNSLNQERTTYRQQRDKSAQALKKQLRAAFMSGEQEYLKLLLNQQDPARFGRVMSYYRYLSEARAEQLKTLAWAMGRLVSVEEKITGEIAALRTLEKNQEAERKRLAGLQRQRERSLKQVAAEIVNDEKKIAGLLNDEKELSQLLTRIETVVKDVPVRLPKGANFAQLKGKLGWPARGDFLQQFGDSRHDGRLRWNGVLIRAPEGREVSAIFHGRVVFADWLRGFGLMTIIDHGDGYMSLYGYNQSLLKQVGDWVEAGEPVATVGNSGGQQGNALYFEIRHNGRAVDPRQWCKRS
ncbi:MAG: murein hydrolase activator EnvC family protein [Permianibacter sp.]